MSQLPHQVVAGRYFLGQPAKNARLAYEPVLDGLLLDGRLVAMKHEDRYLVDGRVMGRSGAVARSAVREAAVRAQRAGYATIEFVYPEGTHPTRAAFVEALRVLNVARGR